MTNADKFEKIFGFDINRLFSWDNEKYYEWADASAQPEQKIVKWIGDNAAERMAYWHDVDLSYLPLDKPKVPKDVAFPKYCPYCGARMEENNAK